ncbi:MAG: hypothetical protein GEV11_09745 [Streptosporangiales bacterium]|nr:hypothetical protein [Streptosporangiales bacterium]
MEIGDLSAVERAVLDAATYGRPLGLGGPEHADGSEPGGRVVRADVLREILLGRLGGEALDPRGVQLAGAHVTGSLELRGMSCRAGLALSRCRLDERIHADDATIPWLDLTDTRLPALHADRLTVAGDLHLGGLRGHGGGAAGTIRLFDARISGDLDCMGAHLANPSGPAPAADRMSVAGYAFLSYGRTARARPRPCGSRSRWRPPTRARR